MNFCFPLVKTAAETNAVPTRRLARMLPKENALIIGFNGWRNRPGEFTGTANCHLQNNLNQSDPQHLETDWKTT